MHDTLVAVDTQETFSLQLQQMVFDFLCRFFRHANEFRHFPQAGLGQILPLGQVEELFLDCVHGPEV